MSTEPSTTCRKQLARYSIASGDMYYTELGLRDVMLLADERGNFRIRGDLVGGQPLAMIELCEIFLEYAMCCCLWCDPEKARYQMQSFAQCIGSSIGEFLRENTGSFTPEHPSEHALEQLFQTVKARTSIAISGAIEHFIVMDCPLERAAERSGLGNIELAHYGINCLCQSMIQAIQPGMMLYVSEAIRPEFDFTLLRPEFA